MSKDISNQTAIINHISETQRQYVSRIQDLESELETASSRLATLQAENEKLWKLLEGEVKSNIIRWGALEVDEELQKAKDEAWAAFQKANDLTQNKK